MKKITLLFLLFIAFSSGCMKNNNIQTERFAEAKLMPTMNTVLSKALIDDSNIASQTIRVQVSKNDGVTSYTAPANAKYTLTNSGSNWVLSDILYLSTDNATIFAYAPCPADPTTVESGSYNTLSRSLDIPSEQAMTSQDDYLWSNQNTTAKGSGININSTNTNVHLTMNHALSLVSFVIYKENFTGTGMINKVKISDLSTTPSLTVNKTVGNDLKMNIINGSVSGGEKSASVTANSINTLITETAVPETDPEVLKTKANAYVLIVPATVTDKTKVQFTFTIDNKDYSVSLSGVGGVSWLAGQQYIYKVKLSGTQMSLESVTVTPWTRNYSGEVNIN